MSGRSRALVFGLLGAAALIAASMLEPAARQALVAVAVAFFFIAATGLGRAGSAATALAELADRPVQVLVWGQPLPTASAEGFQLVRLRALGAGLHLLLRARSGDGGVHELKVAQPAGVAFDRPAGRAVIQGARYVQWRRGRLPRPEGAPDAPALELELLEVRESGEAPPLIASAEDARRQPPP